jgi:hypothetical protein
LAALDNDDACRRSSFDPYSLSTNDRATGEGWRAVAGRRLSMRKLHEILRLHHELGLARREIGRSVSVSASPALTRVTNAFNVAEDPDTGGVATR